MVLRDGSVAHVRPITPADVGRASSASTPASPTSPSTCASSRRCASSATATSPGSPTSTTSTVWPSSPRCATRSSASARYDRINTRPAPRWPSTSPTTTRARGIGSVCSSTSPSSPRRRASTEFVAEVLPQNRKMLVGLRRRRLRGHPAHRGRHRLGALRDPADRALGGGAALARAPRRGASACTRSCSPTASPSSGPAAEATRSATRSSPTSRRPVSTAPCTPSTTRPWRSSGCQPTPRVTDIPGEVDLAVVAVPAAQVLDVVQDCAEAGVKTLLVVSAGFAEAGPDGAELQDQLLHAARGAGMRVIGPNSFGVINNHPSRSASTPPWRPSCRPPAGSACSRRAAPSASRSSPRQPGAASASRCSPPRATASTSRATTCMQYWIDDHEHRRRRPLPRVDGQPPQVLTDRPAARGHQAGHRGQVRRLVLRRPTGPPGQADAGAARGVRRDAAPGRCHPGRERPPDVRRRPARRPPAAAQGQPGRHRRQLRRARGADRRGLCQLGPRGRARTGLAPVRGPRRALLGGAGRRPSPTPRSTAS